MVEQANASTRTQDLSPAYFDAGQFYFGTLDFWRFDGNLASCRPLLHEIPADRAVDIDTELDVRLAEARLELRAHLDAASTAAASDIPLGMDWNRGG